MSTFNLAISCLTTSICLDSWTWRSRFLCNIALYSIGLYFHHQSHPQLGGVFALAPSLLSFWSYFSSDLQEHIGHLPTWEVHLSVSYLFAFSYCSWGSQGKNTEVACHSLLQLTMFCQTSHHDLSILGGPTHIAHSFIELDKAVVHVISLISFLWLWFSFVCSLMEKDKRLMEAPWWERLTDGETGSCSDGRVHA